VTTPGKAVELQRTSLHLCYVHPDPRQISTRHRTMAHPDYTQKAMQDSTLGRLLGQLLALYTNTPQK
jgi:hypothetical protein